MADAGDPDAPRVTVEEVLPAVAVYFIGFVVTLIIGFRIAAIWSFLGLFVAYGVARLAAQLRTESEINRRNSTWIADHQDAIETWRRERNQGTAGP